MNLLELIVVGCVGNRREMKNRIELFFAELLAPIERGEVLRNEIPTIAGKILEIAGPEIVNHCETRVRKFFVQSKREVGADETSPAGDEQIGRRTRRGHGRLNKS